MTSVGAAAAAAALASTLPHLIRCPPLPSPALFLNQLHFRSRIAAPPLSSPCRRGLGLPPLSASRRGRQRGVEVEFDVDDSWPEEEEDDDDDDGDEAAIPFREMKQWLRNKPAGFGDGRSYDTRLEDEIWEEMERSRIAQLGTVNEVKNEGKKSESGGTKKKKKQEPQPKATDEDPCGTRVRIRNLPRKKNIHRDLQRAFKGFPSLVSISPAVLGNEKTREPICKGFAFLDFTSEEAANKFVQVYSRRTLSFGKVEKQIACDVVNPRGSFNSAKLSDDDSVEIQSKYKNVGLELHKASDIDNASEDSQGRTSDDEPISIRVIDESEAESMPPDVTNDGSSTHIEETENGEMILKGLGSTKSVHPVQKRQKRTSSKKKAVKTYSVKGSKLSLPGSVARLKIKERTVLQGVFSKYCKNVAAES